MNWRTCTILCCLTVASSSSGCGDDGPTAEESTETGDGDGDPGDGDGDPGDGDGDPGDGDGDTGDGDGDTGDGDGDTGDGDGDTGDGDGDTGDGDGDTGDGDGDPGLCSPAPADTACDACTKESCCDQLNACVADADCLCVLECVDGGADPAGCHGQCALNMPNQTFGGLITCVMQSCGQACL